jgi:exosome complex RNA-binding protein Rrp42 (RNase PH superfamily)
VRELTVVPNVVPRHSVGSALVTCAHQKTVVVAAVTLAIGQPVTSEEGDLTISLTNSSSSSSSNGRSGNKEEELQEWLQQTLQTSLLLDPEQLVLVPHQAALWLQVSVVILSEEGGNLIDACFTAAVAAVRQVRLPKIQLGKHAADHIRFHPSDRRNDAPLACRPMGILTVAHTHNTQDPNHQSCCCLADPSRAEAEAGNLISLVVDCSSGTILAWRHASGRLDASTLAACHVLAKGRAQELHSLLLQLDDPQENDHAMKE